MKPIPTVERIHRVIVCSECGKGDFTIVPEHWGREWGPWYCDECGYSIRGRTDAAGESFVEPWRDRIVKTTVTLRSTRPVTLLVQGIRRLPLAGDEDANDEFYYSENTCPTNFIGHPVLEVLDDVGNTDPHGIFAWVKTEVGLPKEVA